MSPVPGAGVVDDGVALVYSDQYAGTATHGAHPLRSKTHHRNVHLVSRYEGGRGHRGGQKYATEHELHVSL